MWLLLDKDNPVRLCMHAPGYSCIFGVWVCVCAEPRVIGRNLVVDSTNPSEELHWPYVSFFSSSSSSLQTLNRVLFLYWTPFCVLLPVHSLACYPGPLPSHDTSGSGNLLIAVGCKIPFDIWWFIVLFRTSQEPIKKGMTMLIWTQIMDIWM